MNKIVGILFFAIMMIHLYSYSKYFGWKKAVVTLFFIPVVFFDAIRSRKKLFVLESIAILLIFTLFGISPYEKVRTGENLTGYDQRTIMVYINDNLHSGSVENRKEMLDIIFRLTFLTVAQEYLSCNDYEYSSISKMSKYLSRNILIKPLKNAGECNLMLPCSSFDNEKLFDLLVADASGVQYINDKKLKVLIKNKRRSHRVPDREQVVERVSPVM